MARLLFALGSLAILGALLFLSQVDSGGSGIVASDSGTGEPGYVATHAELIETGEDGHPLYRLQADRIEQPQPQGTIFLTAPKLDYQPEAGNHWIVSAHEGQLPQDARTADLAGAVHAEGTPSSSQVPVRIDTEQLHLDMTDQVATTSDVVSVVWGGNVFQGRGMRADLKDYRLQLAGEVHGALSH